MPKIHLLLVKGDGNIVLKSPQLSDAEADEQLDLIERSFTLNDPLSLPWVRVLPKGVFSANKVG